jgi:Zn-dependent protease
MSTSQDIIRQLLLFIPPFIFSLCLHEYAHAWVANRLGDSTARYLGRLTLDPIAHMSVFGTLVFPALSILSGSSIFFGWANPVPVDQRNFRNPRRDMALVAAAGPLMNIFLAFFCVFMLAILVKDDRFTNFILSQFPGAKGILSSAIEMLVISISLNLFLAFFNLLPLPPLDGSRIVQGLVNPRMADKIDGMTMQAQVILLILIFSGVLRILAIPVQWVLKWMLTLAGLS